MVHQVADTVYQRADACRHWLFLFSVIKNTMENRKCQLQTWKVEKYSGNLCAARTGRVVCGGSRHPAERGTPPPGGGGSRGLPAETKGGKGTVWFPCPLLTPPNPPLDATPFGRASKKRGAHRDVWCSKAKRLIEAELFAAERCRPAPSGRALLCAANHAK